MVVLHPPLIAIAPQTVLCPIMIWIVLVALFSTLCFAVRDAFFHVRRLHQIPCDRCCFYTGDYRLKCTVHPCAAFSEEAIHCRDYEAIAPHPRKSYFRHVYAWLLRPWGYILKR